MYQTIYVPVDNSRHSNRAVDSALALGKSFGSKLVGCHVYAARMHDYRFKQMEFTLPEEYLVEQELHRQRKIHDSLITMGLELVSDCYLEPMKAMCAEAGLDYEGKMMDGKHSVELVRDIADNPGYDLVVLGALGVGRTRDSQLGSVCNRIALECDRDVWVVKHLPRPDEAERDTILVGVDGSPKSFGALMTAVELGRRFGKRVEVVGVYDPYLHYAVFKGIVEVLTEKAAKVFRFEEQNQLHEEIIDTGLASIYQSHVNVAETMARQEGVEVGKTLLDGKPFQKILDHARKHEPWLLVLGRQGVHSPDGAGGLGSNSENLLRLVPCDVLLTTREVVPELDVKAEESIHWTPEALARMQRVPPQVLGIARTAILRLAIEQGHSVVSSDLVTEAMERFMPRRAAEANLRLAEALVLDRAKDEPVAICRSCGVAARSAQAVRCTVCGGSDFERVSAEVVARIIAEEGGVEEETTYDGRKIRWTQESRGALKAIGDMYQRRRAKARIEKAARIHKLDPIPLELARRFVEEEIGVLYSPSVQPESGEGAANGNARPAAGGNGRPAASELGSQGDLAPAAAPTDEAGEPADLRLLARDGKDVPFLSRLHWSDAALERILRVPAGFMRDRTQGRVEELAGARGVERVDRELVEEGIEQGKQMMEAMLTEQEAAAQPAASPDGGTAHTVAAPAAAGDASCPADAATREAAEAAGCPFGRAAGQGNAEALRSVMESYPLNEVSVVAEMERRRREMKGE
ncbi:MAG TPA: universal stress protein [Thermoanaerobaculia bacterium]|nr:universal stress protein [Thermoanaerobaculia bacterium]